MNTALYSTTLLFSGTGFQSGPPHIIYDLTLYYLHINYTNKPLSGKGGSKISDIYPVSATDL